MTREKWDRGIAQLPDPSRFLTGEGAHKLSYEDAIGLIQGMLSAFSDLGESFEIDQLSRTATILDFCSAISSDTVVLFAFGGPTEVHRPESHIVCGVAAVMEPTVLHIACSAAFSARHLRDGVYVERFHPSVGRYSNDAIAAESSVEIAPKWRWRIRFGSRVLEAK